jgi:hypothetical protein
LFVDLENWVVRTSTADLLALFEVLDIDHGYSCPEDGVIGEKNVVGLEVPEVD